MTEIATREDFEQLHKELADIKALLTIAEVRLPQVVKVKDIARVENVSSVQIYSKQKYLLPNCGVSDYPDGSARWNLNTYLAWRNIPINERKSMYAQFLERLRKNNLEKIENGRRNASAIQDKI